MRTLDGQPLERAALGDRVVLVDFWATWCAPCLAQLPVLRSAWEEHRDRGFEIVGVSVDRASRRELQAFVLRQEMEWTVAHDGRGFDGALASQLGVTSVPRSFLFDRQGRLVAADLQGDALRAALAALLEPAQEAADGGSPLPWPFE